MALIGEHKSYKKTMIIYFFAILLLCIPGFLYFMITNKKTSPGLNQEHYFIFNKITTVEYKSEFDVKTLVDTNYPLVEYPSIDTNTKGTQVLTFSVYTEQGIQKYTKEIEVKDTIKPHIILKQDTITINQKETIDLHSLVEVNDASDTTITFSELHVNQIGVQKVKIVAKDEANNQAEAELAIEIKPNVEPIQHNQKSNQTEHSVKVNEKPKSKEKPQAPTPQKPTSTVFLFSQGYDFNTSFNACRAYLDTVGSGMCNPIQKDGIYTGYEYIP